MRHLIFALVNSITAIKNTVVFTVRDLTYHNTFRLTADPLGSCQIWRHKASGYYTITKTVNRGLDVYHIWHNGDRYVGETVTLNFALQTAFYLAGYKDDCKYAVSAEMDLFTSDKLTTGLFNRIVHVPNKGQLVT